jgi:hypothetical protein
LLPHSVVLEVGNGLRICVLGLEMSVAIREEVGGEKDRAVLPILRRTLEEKRKALQIRLWQTPAPSSAVRLDPRFGSLP